MKKKFFLDKFQPFKLLIYSFLKRLLSFKGRRKTSWPHLNKLPANPLLEPKAENDWESKAVFNPAAINVNNQIHLIYRAVGDKDISVLGYAVSCSGKKICSRLSWPIYFPTQPFEGSLINFLSIYNSDYISGIGCGGCEDPRLTLINDRIYMIYVAFNGYSPPRLALTSIKLNDFLNQNWNWKKPVLISKPGVIDKSGCLLPEKIDGKYVIFHRVFPNILIDFVDSLEFDGKTFLKGEFTIAPRKNCWDSRKVGIGAPPIKTQDGWLAIYHAVDDKDDSKYKIGAMLLDLNNPTKVLYRSSQPILEPTEPYENNGHKFGVIYPCGAVVVNHQILVYYGGSDMTVCLATADLKTFLSDLKQTGKVKLTKQKND